MPETIATVPVEVWFWLTRDGDPIKLHDGVAYVWEYHATSSQGPGHWIAERSPLCHSEDGTECDICVSCPACCSCVTCKDCGDKVEETCANCSACEDCCDCHTCDNCDAKVDSTCSRCSGCESCCERKECDSCGRKGDSDDMCGECDSCQRCCECWYCDGCNEHFSRGSSCGECSSCESCCECEKGLPRIHVDTLTWHGRKGKVGPQRYVATEIEVTSTSDDKVSGIVRRWGAGIVDDGSLGSQGSEINTAPARGEAWPKQIAEICEGLRKSHAKVDRSCGLHVHIDARDFTYYDVRRLIRLYARLEPALFSLVAESRRSYNTYALPCAIRYLSTLSTDSHMRATKHSVLKGIYQYDPDRHINKKRMARDKYNPNRYMALNLHSWIYRGTIEYRLHHGTTDANKITMWGELWSHILEYVYTHTDKQIEALPGLPSYDTDLAHKAESYAILRDHVLAGMPELQAYVDERVQHFGTITITGAK